MIRIWDLLKKWQKNVTLTGDTHFVAYTHNHPKIRGLPPETFF